MASRKVSAKAAARRIARENAAFDKLSPEEKRCAIAGDVISQLNLGKLVADHVYVSAAGGATLFGKLKTVKPPTEWYNRKVVLDQEVGIKAKTCHVCGIGSLFVCGVRLADRLFGKDIQETWDNECTDAPRDMKRGDTVRYLKRFFTESQLNSIENAYEGGWDFIGDDTDRLVAIMQNIIANKGQFKMNKRPVALWVTEGFQG